jgi:hypothetical protein
VDVRCRTLIRSSLLSRLSSSSGEVAGIAAMVCSIYGVRKNFTPPNSHANKRPYTGRALYHSHPLESPFLHLASLISVFPLIVLSPRGYPSCTPLTCIYLLRSPHLHTHLHTSSIPHLRKSFPTSLPCPSSTSAISSTA